MAQKRKSPRGGGLEHIEQYLKNLQTLYAPVPSDSTGTTAPNQHAAADGNTETTKTERRDLVG